MPAARPSDLKLNNRRQILELFKFGAVHSVAHLSHEVGVSRQTVMKNIQFFLEKGIIVSDGKADSGSMGGKRAELFKLAGDRYLLSAIVCSDAVSITLINFRCEVIEDRVLKDTDGLNTDALVEAVSSACERMLEERGIDRETVHGFCVTATGPVGAEGATRFNAIHPDWGKRVPIAEAFRKHLGPDMTVIAENLGKVCGCAAMTGPGVAGERLATVLTFRDDVSACLIVDGQTVSGREDYVSELGHMVVNSGDDEVCGCGSRGCLERLISVSRLQKLCAENAERFPDSSLLNLQRDSISVQDVFAASAAGDPLARWLSQYAARQFADALRNLALIFNPDRMVLQGDYASADEVFLETLRGELSAFRCFSRCGEAQMPFRLDIDTRPLQTLSTLGAYTLLIDLLFADETNYV